MNMTRRRRWLLAACFWGAATQAHAGTPVQQTFFRLASSNGHGAILLDLQQARLTHFREHLFATEEPVLDSGGSEVWVGNQLQVVHARDLLFDAYFGVRANGSQGWLTAAPVDLAASGFAPWEAGRNGGTGVVTMVQQSGGLTATQYVFAPQALPHAAFVMALHLHNGGAVAVNGVSAFAIHNLHLGYGRPGVMQEVGTNGETLLYGPSGFVERGFAGVALARGLPAPTHHGASDPSVNPGLFAIVNGGGTADFPDLNGARATADDSVSGFQFDVGNLAPDADAWVAVVVAHHGDPFADAEVSGWLDAYIGTRSAQQLVTAELAGWAAFQASLVLPGGLSGDEETLVRHSAVTLSMAQVQESSAYLRQWLTQDGESRFSRFAGPLPGLVSHRAGGAVLASLPPGEWTVAWARDGAYAASAMAHLGMGMQARSALLYFLNAEAGRFQSWAELAPYNMPPYQITMARYYGFGVEETDFNSAGPNLEFDGFGLVLWALRNYQQATGDPSLVTSAWDTISQRVADPLLALVNPVNGLIQPDSSIWETHWNGRQRTWTYTSITAARGLCDAAELATQQGDLVRAQQYRAAAEALRAAIAARLTRSDGALASNAEELASGTGMFDAAVVEAVAMGLFEPTGRIATATLAALDANLSVAAGPGWSRNDDRTDHSAGPDLSPWGSEYDSAEWVITDLRGAVAHQLAGNLARAEQLRAWVLNQSLANYLAVSETYDEATGAYKFNAPMVGFGAGAYALALANRQQPLDDPACGAYFDESSGSSSSSGGLSSSASTSSSSGTMASSSSAASSGSLSSSSLSSSSSSSSSSGTGTSSGANSGSSAASSASTPSSSASASSSSAATGSSASAVSSSGSASTGASDPPAQGCTCLSSSESPMGLGLLLLPLVLRLRRRQRALR